MSAKLSEPRIFCTSFWWRFNTRYDCKVHMMIMSLTLFYSGTVIYSQLLREEHSYISVLMYGALIHTVKFKIVLPSSQIEVISCVATVKFCANGRNICDLNHEPKTKKSGNSCIDPIILLAILIYFWLILINTKKRPRTEIIKTLSSKYSTFPLPNCPGKLSINLLKRT